MSQTMQKIKFSGDDHSFVLSNQQILQTRIMNDHDGSTESLNERTTCIVEGRNTEKTESLSSISSQHKTSIINSESTKKKSQIPIIPLAVACLITLNEVLQFGALFPFVYFFVADSFGISGDESSLTANHTLGLYVGLLTSAFCAAQLLTALPWGMLSDRWGRKPVILIGLAINGVLMALFGLSTSYGMAIALRAACGLVNGNIGIAKSLIGDVTDDTNRAMAFAIWETAFGFGAIAGPSLGGILSKPADRFPGVFTADLWKEHPYFLPCLACSSVSFIGIVLVVGFFKETLHPETPGRRSPVEMQQIDKTSQPDQQASVASFGLPQDGLPPAERPFKVHSQMTSPASLTNQNCQDQSNLFRRRQSLESPIDKSLATRCIDLHHYGGAKTRESVAPCLLSNMIPAEQKQVGMQPPVTLQNLDDSKGTLVSMTYVFNDDTNDAPASKPALLLPTRSHPELFANCVPGVGKTSCARRASSALIFERKPDIPQTEQQETRKSSNTNSIAMMRDPWARRASLLSLSTTIPTGLGAYVKKGGLGQSNGSRASCTSRLSIIPDKTAGLLYLVAQPRCYLALTLYTLWSFIQTLHDETLAIYAVSPNSAHGLGISSAHQGVLMACAGIFGIMAQLLLFPRCKRWFGIIGMALLSAFGLTLISFIEAWIANFAKTDFLSSLPQSPSTSTNANGIHSSNPLEVPILLGLLTGLRGICVVFGYVTIMLLINDCVDMTDGDQLGLGAVHGLGQIACSLARTAGPVIAGLLWTWSSTLSSVWWRTPFFLMTGLSILTAGVVSMLWRLQPRRSRQLPAIATA